MKNTMSEKYNSIIDAILNAHPRCEAIYLFGSHAKDYVKAMWLMLQQDQADDYVVSSGVFHTVEKLGEIAFGHLGLKFKDYYGRNERFIRPGDPVNLIGDPARAKDILSWAPEYSFEAMIKEMVDFDLADLGGA